MNESDKQFESIFELLEGKEVKEPAVQLNNGTVVNLMVALADMYNELGEIEGTENVRLDIDLLATLLLSDENEIAKDRLITWQANMLTHQLEKEVNDAKH